MGKFKVTVAGTLGLIILGLSYLSLFQYPLVTQYLTIRYSLQELSLNIAELNQFREVFTQEQTPELQRVFNRHFQNVDDDVQELQSFLSGINVAVQEVQELSDTVSQYHTLFNHFVDERYVIGINENAGLYGSMRDAAHKLENLFIAAEDEALLNNLLSMRRNEKDFMLRKDLVYFEKFSKNYQAGRENILRARHLSEETRGQSLTYLDAYKKLFIEIVEKMRSEGLSHQEGKVKKMNALSGRCKDIIDRINSMIVTVLQREETKIKAVRGILTVFSAICIISLLCVLFMIKNDTTSKSENLSTLTSSMPEDRNGTPG